MRARATLLPSKRGWAMRLSSCSAPTNGWCCAAGVVSGLREREREEVRTLFVIGARQGSAAAAGRWAKKQGRWAEEREESGGVGKSRCPL
jgi:hypothetical protein